MTKKLIKYMFGQSADKNQDMKVFLSPKQRNLSFIQTSKDFFATQHELRL